MGLLNKIKSSAVKGISSALVVSSLLVSGCATTYCRETVALPEKRQCSKVERFVPFDKVYRPFEACGLGLLGTTYGTVRSSQKSGCLFPVTLPFPLACGLAGTVVDTAINVVAWPFVEVGEMVTGKTLNGPYLPNTRSFVEGMATYGEEPYY